MADDHEAAIARQQEHLIQASSERFNEGIATIFVALEELRQTQNQLEDQHDALEHLLEMISNLDRWSRDARAVDEQTTLEMHQHVLQRVVDAAYHVLKNLPPEPEGATPDEKQQIQGQVARMVELNLIFGDIFQKTIPNAKDKLQHGASDIVNLYCEYQRVTLRNRAKPCIAELVTHRRNGMFAATKHNQNSAFQGSIQLEDDEDKETNTQFHGTVLAVILGEAGALIHPLAVWKSQLQFAHEIETSINQFCIASIAKLDETAEMLAKTVSDWFFEDRPIERWMAKANDLDVVLNDDDLFVLDSVVEEMSVCCQVMKSYHRLVASVQDTSDSTIDTLLPEWTLKYSTLEGFWALQNWKMALRDAVPVTIVLGTDIRVPSVVEDAHYLSTRALQRAARTSAVSTVANLISHDVWSSGSESTSVYKALQDRMGCWQEAKVTPPATSSSSPSKAPSSGNFAASLASALDEDIGQSRTPPSSGNFLVSLVNKEQIQQRELDTTFCLLNGIHAAEGAAHALCSFLESLDGDDEVNEKDTAFIQLLQEELSRYAGSYKSFLSEGIDAALEKWCGSRTWKESSSKGCFVDLRQFLESEVYSLDATSFSASETDERQESTLIRVFTESKFVQELRDKCELHVRQTASESIAKVTVNVVLETLWETSKKFNDWGAMLFAKQSRLLQDFVCNTIVQSRDDSTPIQSSPEMQSTWQRLSDCATVLQLEKPSDWLIYSNSNLSPDEVSKTLSLRVEFSKDAIDSVVSTLTANSS